MSDSNHPRRVQCGQESFRVFFHTDNLILVSEEVVRRMF